jgi:hypothetical protein
VCVDPITGDVERGGHGGGVDEIDMPWLRREQVGDAVGNGIGKCPFPDVQLQDLLARLRRIE